MRLALIAVLLVFGAECGFAQQTRSTGAASVLSAESHATVERRGGKTLHVTVNSSFEFLELLRDQGDGYDSDLLKTVQRNEVDYSSDGVNGSLNVSAWRMNGNRIGKLLWSFAAKGNEGRAYPDVGLYSATSFPCCSAMWVHEYFSLRNGAHLYTTNGPPALSGETPEIGLLRVSGHSYKDWRFVAFGASYEKGHEQPELQYGSDAAVKQRFILRGHEYGDNFDVPEIRLVDDRGELVRDLAGDLTFMIVLKFNEDQETAAEIRIPVINDVLLVEQAILPKGYTLTLK